MPILDELKAANWCDGDFSQNDNIINDISLNIYRENKISAKTKMQEDP